MLAHCGSFIQGAHEKGVSMRTGVPKVVSGRTGRVRGHCKHSGLGALLTDFRAGLGLMGGQFGFEDDIRHSMTGPSRDTSTTFSIHKHNHAPCKWHKTLNKL